MPKVVDQRAHALNLFVKGFLPIEIGKLMGVSESTVYRWKKDDAKAGRDWDEEVRRNALSPIALKERYYKLVRDVIEQAEQDEKYRLSPSFADSMAKHIKNLKSLAPEMLNDGIVLDFVEITNRVLDERAPELKRQLVEHWLIIRNRLLEYMNKRSI